MKIATFVGRVTLFGTGAIAAFGMTAAMAGGNGNGGNGSGGAHGAATAGMTWHSEPVASPWNRPFGAPYKASSRTGTATTVATRPEQDRTENVDH